MERSADLASPQGLDGGLGKMLHRLRLVGFPLQHGKSRRPQGGRRLVFVMAGRHVEKDEAGLQLTANQPRQGDRIALRHHDVAETITELVSQPHTTWDAWRAMINAGGPKMLMGDMLEALACWHFRVTPDQLRRLRDDDAAKVLAAVEGFMPPGLRIGQTPSS